MTINQFLEGKKVQLTDLFGAWKQKGFDSSSEDAETKITKKLSFMRCHFAKHLKKNPMPEAVECKFKREDVNGKGDGEWMLVFDAAHNPLAMFSASVEGFVKRYGEEGAVAEVAAPVKTKQAKNSSAKETRTPKEIQDAVPLELRHSWFNYDLAEKLTEKCLAEYDAAKLPAKTEDEE